MYVFLFVVVVLRGRGYTCFQPIVESRSTGFCVDTSKIKTEWQERIFSLCTCVKSLQHRTIIDSVKLYMVILVS